MYCTSKNKQWNTLEQVQRTHTCTWCTCTCVLYIQLYNEYSSRAHMMLSLCIIICLCIIITMYIRKHQVLDSSPLSLSSAACSVSFPLDTWLLTTSLPFSELVGEGTSPEPWSGSRREGMVTPEHTHTVYICQCTHMYMSINTHT